MNSITNTKPINISSSKDEYATNNRRVVCVKMNWDMLQKKPKSPSNNYNIFGEISNSLTTTNTTTKTTTNTTNNESHTEICKTSYKNVQSHKSHIDIDKLVENLKQFYIKPSTSNILLPKKIIYGFNLTT